MAFVLMAMLVTACAHTPRPKREVAQSDAASQELYECREERQTGTIISERVCRKRSDIAADRNNSRNMTDAITRRGTQQIKRN